MKQRKEQDTGMPPSGGDDDHDNGVLTMMKEY